MRTRSLLAWIIGVTVLAAGCGSGAGSAALTSAVPAPEEPDITVAAIPAVDLARLYIAQDRGLFARQGLHVTIVPVPSSQSVITEQLAGHTIGVNGVNSIGPLLISALLSAHGVAPAKVRFITVPGGFPVIPGQLEHGAWGAAFLAEPYITAAGQQYGQQVLADLDQGAVLNLPVDGYVATRSWAQVHPAMAAAFTRAIEQGQAIANSDISAAQAIMARYDGLPPEVTGSMALPSSYPVGRVEPVGIQRVAAVMLKFGVLSQCDAAGVSQGTLVRSMISPG